ncbi:hypothetical protein COW36_08520 [bacterium (Candidatus Blackallbacteria) CG17_big_fil_post_rev_8_21_14_2_50_48_46]|uniref:TraB/GumN family protein n=1 Tax=bacterium (Candidatus Blackallbacteria) CG17_big_fil_post_rev_8_21_14_2_50_48_46 TaxID=2014261 RepID=A0A2M7G676_9BACT|nr:MAG: hypothetical protein COW64_05820 [bacterium (Candidatus Blackallbacteria) CG18_big_fil_WC_8_21_14_2_50_49_26]PIW17530.1 MAG: hypothetical protein COW36_08520 [bacterium (Candidatus Blackallbacteria) CG17_big_fil_post_rev_8_21_14_2_50_48_46]PIW48385.1 MAG: hypothetical protein COW20_09870 [bacterium (Candidatus Blackallbacteria) CG13_big_fil_rev_8_21_14_2_50_49_14]
MQILKPLKQMIFGLGFALTLSSFSCAQLPVTTGNSTENLTRSNQKTTASSEITNTGSQTAVSVPGLKNILVWEVRPPQAETPVSYLIGTVHAPFDASFQAPEKVILALKSAARFYMEADVSNAAAINSEIQKFAVDVTRDNQKSLSESEWATLKTRLTAQNLPDPVLMRLRPWFINFMLESPPSDPAVSPAQIMDQVLMNTSKAAGVEIGYLETLTEQIQALADGVSDDIQFTRLKKNLSQPVKDSIAELKRVITAYNSGDLASLAKFDQEDRAEEPEYYQAIVTARNQNWIKILEPVLKERASVVAVGMGHLSGSSSLRSLLETKGFKLQQLK